MSLLASAQRFLGGVGSTARALFEQRASDCAIVHDVRLERVPASIAVQLLCGHVKGRLRCPDNLTIILMHNYARTPLAEESLRYVGIQDYVVLSPKFSGAWRDSIKLTTLSEYLSSGKCETDFVLYIDSRDAFVRGNLEAVLDYMQQATCELLFSAETTSFGYECMPSVKAWADPEQWSVRFTALLH